jgi:hypothetical protein
MDSKTFGIGILTLTAVALLIANFFAPRPVAAIESVANEDMQAVTARYQNGGDAIYLLDHSSGKLAIFTVDNRAGLRVRTVVNVEDAFREAAGAGGAAAGGGGKR